MDKDFEIGESDGNFDASSEALEDRWEAADAGGDTLVDETPAGDDMVEVVLEDGVEMPEGAVAVEDAEEAPADPSMDDGEPGDEQPELDLEDAAGELPEKYRGKTPEEVARLAAESESYFGKKLTELEEQRKAEQAAHSEQFEQLQRLLAEDVQQRRQQAAGVESQGLVGQLLESALGDPVGAFNNALQMVAQGQVPETAVDAVIDRVREGVDGDLAADMRGYLTEERAKHAAKQQIEREVQPLRKARYEAEAKSAVLDFAAAAGEDFTEFQSELASAMKPIQPELERRGVSAAQIRQVLEHQLNLLRGANPHRAAAYKEALRQAKANQQTEAPSGAGAQHREVPRSAEEEYRQSALKPRESGANELMAGFPGM